MVRTNELNMLLILPLNSPYDFIVGNVDEAAKKNKDKIGINKPELVMPNGVLSIAAYVQKHFPGVHIKILDLNAVICMLGEENHALLRRMSSEDFWRYAIDLLDGFNPELIGLSVLFASALPDLSDLSCFLKEKFAGSIVFAGGHVPTASPDIVFQRSPAIDYIVYGEGEIPVRELCEDIFAGKEARIHASSNSSWITREKLADAFFKAENKLIYDLDEIPAYNLDNIVRRDFYSTYGSPTLFKEERDGLDCLCLLTTRGCPGRCLFCASRVVHGRKIRAYSEQRVKDDINKYIHDYRIQRITFYDDHFISNKTKAINILEFMRANGYKCDIANVAFFAMDNDVARAIKRAGIESVVIAVENANENTFKNIIHKYGGFSKVKEAIKCLKDAGILIICNIVIGLPGETKEDMEINKRNMVELGCNWYQCYVAAPLPGSELYDICKENGYISDTDDIFLMNYKHGLINTPEFSAEYVENKVYETNLYVNFVHNYDMRAGNYATALMLFERVINDIIDTHAFAYYFAATCAKELGQYEKAARYGQKYLELIEKLAFWRNWAEHFGLNPLNLKTALPK
ncbi:radical SAM protein [Desulfovibrio sp. OttesenSCG-928-C14]|nr:radical SAM protein [Desulfovibrio sp. OttesenSCG-928-C14]